MSNPAFAAVQLKEFRYYIIQRFFFIMGLRMIATVVGWKMYLLTRSPFALGLLGLAEVIPAVSMALYAGHVVDKSDKRKLLIRAIIFYLLLAASLLFLTSDHTEKTWARTRSLIPSMPSYFLPG